MNRIPFLAVVVVAMCGALAHGNETEREITDIEQAIAQAIVKQDVAFVERVFDDDFVYTGVRGEMKSKAELLANLKSGELKFDLLAFDDIRVRVHGHTAVATGRATTKGRGPQGEIAGQFRYTRVYIKKQEAWRLVAFQGTPLASP